MNVYEVFIKFEQVFINAPYTAYSLKAMQDSEKKSEAWAKHIVHMMEAGGRKKMS